MPLTLRFDTPRGLLATLACAGALGLAGCGRDAAPAAAAPADVEGLQQQVATLRRSDQISRDANGALQKTLAEREEEIAGLRADVAFYERLVGATEQRRGLSVHALHLVPQAADVWHFTSTLTQNLNRGAISEGALSLAIEGTQGGALRQFEWGALRQRPGADGVPYSFKYFQQVNGEVFLPKGFTPTRVVVRLQPRGGSAIEQAYPWVEAIAGQSPGA